MKRFRYLLAFLFLASMAQTLQAQTDSTSDLEKMLANDEPSKVFANNAFKSTRVVNGQSMEMLGKGVLDFRILHRFGSIKGGYHELFGLDQASMRIGFDYGISKNLTIGYGRSTYNKELDGFVKYRVFHQHTGKKAIPFSLLWVSGITMTTVKIADFRLDYFKYRLGYFHQAIIGRKFNEQFSLQLSPTMVHRNVVELNADKNDMVACGVGTRYKFSKRSAVVIETFPILSGGRKNYNRLPLSIGFDIETGGHVFQLHVSNSRGMNEKAFITETIQNFGKGEINFGFNLSRVFTVVKNKESSW